MLRRIVYDVMIVAYLVRRVAPHEECARVTETDWDGRDRQVETWTVPSTWCGPLRIPGKVKTVSQVVLELVLH